jgi:hypothetical protein
MGRLALVVALVLVLLVPEAEARTMKVRWDQDALVAYRVWDEVGYIPIKGISPTSSSGARSRWVRPLTRGCGPTARPNRQSTTIALREAHREAMRKYYPAVFADRDLTAAERTRFDVLADPRRVCR